MKRRSALVLKACAGLVLGLGVAYAGWSAAAARGLRHAYVEMAAAGRPMNAAQVIPPEVPDAGNAALCYQAAVLRLKATPAGGSNQWTRLVELTRKPEDGPPLTASESAELQRLLQEPAVGEALRWVAEGAQRPGCRFDVNYCKGIEVRLDHLGLLRHLSRIVAAAARQQAADGDAAGAWRTAVTGLACADALRVEPLLIGQLSRLAQMDVGIETVQQLCRFGPPPAGEVAAMRRRLEAFDDPGPLALAIDGERLLWGEWAFAQSPEQLRRIEGTPKAVWLAREARIAPLFDRDHALYLRYMRHVADWAGRPFVPNERDPAEALMADWPVCVATSLLAPVFSSIKPRFYRTVAAARLTRAGLTALQYRQAHGAFPKSLAELDPAPPSDPFTGRELGYRVEPGGFVLCSTGPDLKDDGGSVEKGEDGRPKDVAWRFTEEAPKGAQP